MVPIDAWLAEAEEHCRRTRRPLVTLSYAQSLDGCIAARRGVQTALSGPESMALTHRLRAAHDGILVGVGTVLSDDPRLSVRLVPGRGPQPIVLDSHLRTPLNARLLQGEPRPWIAACAPHSSDQSGIASYAGRLSALEGCGARVLTLPPDGDGRVPLPALLERLAEAGIRSLMIEGGARVITSFLVQRLVDQVVLTIAPIYLGGLPALETPAIEVPAMEGRSSEPGSARAVLACLEDVEYSQLGDDLIAWGRVK